MKGVYVFCGDTCLVWHDHQQLATVAYELAQTGSVWICEYHRQIDWAAPKKRPLALFGLRLTLVFEDGQRADCFLADSTGRIALSGNGPH